MKMRTTIFAAAFVAVVFVTPAHALEYSIDGVSAGDFGTPTSDTTVYVGAETAANVDRSKNAALIPPSFGTPTSYLPGSGEPLTPNLITGGGTTTDVGTGDWNVIYPDTTAPTGPIYPAAAYTSVTSDLYYAGGHLGTLKIPALDLRVKVYQGTGSTTLAKGAGHFSETSIWDGNVCVAAHNRGANNYFGQLHTLDIGDKITLTTKLGTRTYAVTSVEKISETDSSMLSSTSENCVTLFTCVRNQSAYRWCVRAVEM